MIRLTFVAIIVLVAATTVGIVLYHLLWWHLLYPLGQFHQSPYPPRELYG